MTPDDKIYIAGHRGLVGSALVRRLRAAGYENLLLRTSKELDLTRQTDVEEFFRAEQPDHVFLAAAKVGGILANDTFPADFISVNLAIQQNMLTAAHGIGVNRLLFLGSSCIYPKRAPQPMKEEYLLTGALEPTNSAYALAKIAGVEMCRAFNRQHGTVFLPVMPTNLYGPNDNFDLRHSHVLPALIRKFHLARLAASRDWDAIAADERRHGPIPEDIRSGLGLPGTNRDGRPPRVVLWGTGAPYREFLHVDDLADACVFLMNHPNPAAIHPLEDFLLNIGTGEDLTIREAAEMTADIAGFSGEVIWDAEKPDGTPRKLLDVSRMTACGWRAGIPLADGIRAVHDGYRRQSGGPERREGSAGSSRKNAAPGTPPVKSP